MSIRATPAESSAEQTVANDRRHADDRLMLWFDFFDHDCDAVIERQGWFMEKVAARL